MAQFTGLKRYSGSLIRVAVITLLAVTFLMPFFSARNFGPVTDEVPHIAAGYSYWKTGEISLNKQHPPLVKLLASAPILLMDVKFDSADLALGQWQFGKKFLFSNDAKGMLFWARLVPMLLSVLLGYFIYHWAGELFSDRWVGIIALGIYAFMPNILAHAQFVTTDLAVACFSFITLYWLWKKNFLWTGIFFGLALGTKFSAIILIPIVVIGMGLQWKKTIAIAAIAFAVLYVIYLFPGNLHFYLDGFRALYEDRSSTYLYYLNGNFSPDRFWHYFPEAFLIKTPIPFLIGLVVALLYARKFKFARMTNILLWGTPILFLLAAIFKAENIGVRYILPVYPFFIVVIAGAGMRLIQNVNLKMQNDSSKFKNFTLSFFILIFAFSIWYVIGTIHIAPDYLAYFNEFVSGPENGYKYLDDSNLEWGQDIKSLAKYQQERPGVKVVYPWTAIDLSYYGITNNQFGREDEWWRNPSGTYAVSMFYLTRAKATGIKYGEPDIDWLSKFQPQEKIGYSYFVYEF